MPRSHCWGRRIHLSTDDYVCAASWSALTRALFLGAALALLLSPSPAAAACARVAGARVDLALGACVLSALALAQDVLLAVCSSRGTPLRGEGARASVPAQVSLRAATLLLEAALAALALAASQGALGALPAACSDAPAALRSLWTAAAALVLAGACLASLGFGCLLGCSCLCAGAALQRRGGSAEALQLPGGAEALERARLASSDLWAARWRAASALAPGVREAEEALQKGAAKALQPAAAPALFRHVGDVASVAFQPLSQHDLTLGDTLTGLALFTSQQQKQRAHRQAAPVGAPFDWRDASQLARLQGAARFMPHSYAAYAGIATVLDAGCAAPCCLGGAAVLQAGEGAAGLCARALGGGGGGGGGGAASLPAQSAAPPPPRPARLQCFGGLGRDARRLPPCLDLHALAVRATLCAHAQCGAARAPARPSRTPTLLHSSPRTGVARLPWVCTVDHDARALVVSMRGTLHVEDVLTDALAQGLCLGDTAEGQGIGAALALAQGRSSSSSSGSSSSSSSAPPPLDLAAAYVHAGFWHAACAVRRDLLERGALECARSSSSSTTATTTAATSIAGSSSGAPALPAPPSQQQQPPLQLVVVGHSLGAGVAAMLALQLLPDFPGLHCYAFAPPTAVASPLLAEQCAPFVTSVALGEDVVTGLTVGSLRSLFQGALAALQASTASKAASQASFCCRSLGLCLLPWGCRVALGLARAEPSEGSSLLQGSGSSSSSGGSSSVSASESSAAGASAAPASALSESVVLKVDGLGSGSGSAPAAAAASLACQNSTRPLALPGKVLHLRLAREGPADCLSLGLSAVLGPVLGDALAAVLWSLACVCSWRVRREYTPQWISGTQLARPGEALNVSMRGMLEHLPHSYVHALASLRRPAGSPPA